MAKIEDPQVQTAILERVKTMTAPLCGALPSANWRGRAVKIYELAKELQDDIRKANP